MKSIFLWREENVSQKVYAGKISPKELKLYAFPYRNISHCQCRRVVRQLLWHIGETWQPIFQAQNSLMMKCTKNSSARNNLRNLTLPSRFKQIHPSSGLLQSYRGLIPTFRDYLSVPSSRFKQSKKKLHSWKWDRYVVPKRRYKTTFCGIKTFNMEEFKKELYKSLFSW